MDPTIDFRSLFFTNDKLDINKYFEYYYKNSNFELFKKDPYKSTIFWHILSKKPFQENIKKSFKILETSLLSKEKKYIELLYQNEGLIQSALLCNDDLTNWLPDYLKKFDTEFSLSQKDVQSHGLEALDFLKNEIKYLHSDNKELTNQIVFLKNEIKDIRKGKKEKSESYTMETEIYFNNIIKQLEINVETGKSEYIKLSYENNKKVEEIKSLTTHLNFNKSKLLELQEKYDHLDTTMNNYRDLKVEYSNLKLKFQDEVKNVEQLKMDAKNKVLFLMKEKITEMSFKINDQTPSESKKIKKLKLNT